MSKKLFFVLPLVAVLAIGCTKSGESQNQTGSGNDEGGNTPGQVGGIYSETFAGYGGKVDSGYLAQESFTSTATGVTWTLDFGKIDQTEDHEAFYEGHCFTMGGKSGKADNGKSVLSTSVLSDGITHLEFDYVANKEKKLEVQVLVGSNVVWTSGTMTLVNNGTSDPKVLEHKSFDISGAASDAVVKFINISEARRISIGNITWTNATGKGGNGKIFEGGSGSGEGDEGDEGEEGEGGESGQNITMTAKTALAEYYGDYYDANSQDWVLTLENSATQESLCIEFFNAANSTDIVGTYDIDIAESANDGTAFPGYIDEDGYIYPTFYFNESTEDYALAVDGSLEITKSGSTYTIKANFTDETGRKFGCNYTGTVAVKEGDLTGGGEDDEDEGGESGGDDEAYTTLTSDVTISGISFAKAYYYGDYFEAGTNDWQFYIGNDNEELGFELFTNLTATTPEGTYTIDTEYSCGVGTAWDGYDYGGYSMPAYYSYATGDYAYPTSGTITISKGSGSNYTVAVAVYDELGHKISLNYTGEMEVGEGEFSDEDESYEVAKAANSSKILKASHKTAGKAIIKSFKAKKEIKAARYANSCKAAKAKRAHKAKAIRIAR
ncbi:MAG: hypothetical protein MJY55_05355 [Bacteroidales bacterium]|nr:hypothetical protein [Bacteroidales bacterium]